jgi:hypothetical protein
MSYMTDQQLEQYVLLAIKLQTQQEIGVNLRSHNHAAVKYMREFLIVNNQYYYY